MKLSYLFFVAILFSSQLQAQQATTDTVFIRHSDPGEEYNAVYIDTSHTSEWYHQLSLFEFDGYDSASYANSLESLRKQHVLLKKNTIAGLPMKWINIEQYDHRFYAYKPCDFMHHRMIKITDSALILYGEEGPEAIDIDRFSFDPQNGYVFTPAVQHAYGLKTIKLTIIDEKKELR